MLPVKQSVWCSASSAKQCGPKGRHHAYAVTRAASQKAYWDIKRNFLDTVLFYKIGKVGGCWNMCTTTFGFCHWLPLLLYDYSMNTDKFGLWAPAVLRGKERAAPSLALAVLLLDRIAAMGISFAELYC